jgi:2-dehydropantoate 2-reductase
MKVCIVGAGAIGSFVGTRLAAAGNCQVSALARGATLAALRKHGWRLEFDQALLRSPVAVASDHANEIGAQDLVIIAVKGPAMAAAAADIEPLLGPDTIVLPMMNGVPWWFAQGIAAIGGAPLDSVDAGGGIARAIAYRRVLGGVVHASVQMAEPGRAVHRMGHGLIVGEPDGGRSARSSRVGEWLSQAGFEITVSSNVRADLWYKLWGNLTMNPVSALTGATADLVLDDPVVRELCSTAMREAAEIGSRIGCPIDQTPEARHQVTHKLGAFKTSMLQDVQAGRAIELDSIVGAVRELGRRVGVSTPAIDALFGLTRLFARVRGLYPPAGR